MPEVNNIPVPVVDPEVTPAVRLIMSRPEAQRLSTLLLSAEGSVLLNPVTGLTEAVYVAAQPGGGLLSTLLDAVLGGAAEAGSPGFPTNL